MSIIPLDVQRRCEQRWAAFARQAPEPSPQKTEHESRINSSARRPKPNGKPAGLSRRAVSAGPKPRACVNRA